MPVTVAVGPSRPLLTPCALYHVRGTAFPSPSTGLVRIHRLRLREPRFVTDVRSGTASVGRTHAAPAPRRDAPPAAPRPGGPRRARTRTTTTNARTRSSERPVPVGHGGQPQHAVVAPQDALVGDDADDPFARATSRRRPSRAAARAGPASRRRTPWPGWPRRWPRPSRPGSVRPPAGSSSGTRRGRPRPHRGSPPCVVPGPPMTMPSTAEASERYGVAGKTRWLKMYGSAGVGWYPQSPSSAVSMTLRPAARARATATQAARLATPAPASTASAPTAATTRSTSRAPSEAACSHG